MWIDAASDPDDGSVRAKHTEHSPAAINGRKWSFCSAGAVPADGVAAPGQHAEHPEGEIQKRVTQLFEQDRQLDGSAAQSAVLLGDVDPEPALLCDRLERLDRRFVRLVAMADVVAR